MSKFRKNQTAPKPQPGSNKNLQSSRRVASIGAVAASAVLAVCAGLWFRPRPVLDHFPVLFFSHETYATVRKRPESLRPAKSPGDADFDSELLLHSRAEAVVRSISQSLPRAEHLWSSPCTINRLTSPIHNFDDFLRVNGSQPAIFSSGSGVIPGGDNFNVDVKDIVPSRAANSLVSCLCNPDWGTNFGEVEIGSNPPARYCLWQYGLLPQYVLEQKGNMSNRELADLLRFQCRLTRNEDVAELFNHVLRQLLEGKRLQTRQFWDSTPKQDKTVLWISSKDTRTPLHTDRYKQLLLQLRGTKHVTIPTSSDLKAEAWNHAGPFNCSKYRSCNARESTHQECLLRPREVLWLPLGAPHDVYSIQPSLTITLRFG